MKERKIIHVDMDAFYASIEQRNNPTLKGKPVIVGGTPENRGVVAACSYEARKFGIHSAMSSARALKLCPHAVFLRPDFDSYCAVSDRIMEIFRDYTDLVEPLSLDEAYLDVTENKKGIPWATAAAREIKQRILDETLLTASAGVSYNKFLAKVASDFNKPNGMTVITPERAGEFIEQLPVRKFYGIGKATEQRLKDLGILFGRDLRDLALADMMRIFGSSGEFYYYIARGIDERTVNPDRVRKSLGKETTLKRDIDDMGEITGVLRSLAAEVMECLQSDGIKARTLTLKVKYHDFQSITRSVTLGEPITEAAIIEHHYERLLKLTEAGKKKIRLLGLSMSNFEENEMREEGCHQLLLPFGGE